MDSYDDNDRPRGGSAAQHADQETLRLGGGARGAAVGADKPDSEHEAETRMRQALGLFGQRPSHAEQPAERRQSGGHMQVGARRHRFVQDGEVPVSVVRGRRDQVAPEVRDRLADEQAADRASREQAERKLAETLTLVRTLQTRLGHAELERDEAVEALRAARLSFASERAQHLVPERPTSERPTSERPTSERPTSERPTSERFGPERVAPDRAVGERIADRVPIEPRAGRPAPRINAEGDSSEPEPVKWWL